MSQTSQLVSALKRLLKSRGVTYAQVATHLGLSEASVKRQFSQQRFTLRTLDAICALIDTDLAELVREAGEDAARLSQLSEAQERELVREPKRLLIAVCVLNHWTLAQIVATYRLGEAECVQGLLQLDRLGLIRLLPENRVRLRVARDFSWRPDGPIHRFFRERVQTDFLDAPFAGGGELLRFQHAMLDPAATARLQQRLLRVLQEFAELHADGLAAPAESRHGTSLLIALRSWEPAAFAALRRAPDLRGASNEAH
ncbi:helix-turn-helix domain-containing protein [Chitinimonas koreensis]|uniref:helix-turn-helix domain-containing protein n=1 Tax=Chitinimonas koreensis TaxID=356302 RepID=UPI00040A7CDE|nr:helix-turn-helix transcriptional regulator [Chitinimonas koreensis]QNM97486.1 helix-turn-helix transcriptional regulator [Chitinimonas koreensis]